MQRMLIFGLGYAGHAIATAARLAGWQVDATGRDGNIAFDAAENALEGASAIVSTVPPAPDGSDPVLALYGPFPGASRMVYLSSTGVYGDAGGAWVDESAPIAGRRPGRNAADRAWLAAGARVLRLPGIYGPGRSPLDRVARREAHRTGIAGQVFSRIHVADIASAVLAALDGPPGAYNIADDLPCSQDAVVEHAARLLGLPPPPVVALDSLSPMARAFYAENRRVANGRAKRLLGWRPRYPDYRAGLLALSATSSPASASAPPTAASTLQR